MLHECIPLQVDYAKAKAVQDGYQPVLYTYVLNKSPEMPMQMERPAVIICPGSGYKRRSLREDEGVAMRFLAAGMHAFVLEYSVDASRYPSAALELAAAVKLVRENAAAWGVCENQIFVLGFSAGGHLCATLGTLWHEYLYEQMLGPAAGEKAPWRPDGMILCYPVITMTGPYVHEGSRNCLLGPSPAPELAEHLSLEKQVDERTPPAFLWHTGEDQSVPVENALLFASALRKAHVPFELHIYEKGGHGLSLCDETTASGAHHLIPDNANWVEMAIRWIKRQRG